MALLHVDFFSETLGLSCNMDVILPQPTTRQIGMDGAPDSGNQARLSAGSSSATNAQ